MLYLTKQEKAFICVNYRPLAIYEHTEVLTYRIDILKMITFILLIQL